LYWVHVYARLKTKINLWGASMPGKILIVDDDIDTLRLVGMMLESEGYEIIAAKDGQRAISLAHSEAPDLIILDIMMPDVDGYAVASQLRREISTRSIPILIFTAKSGLNDKTLGLNLGADGFITKPISTRELVAQVDLMLSPSGESEQVSEYQESGGLHAVLAAKGGMGVSTVAINLGIALHKQTEDSVVVADFRPGQGSIALELGYDQSVSFNHLLDQPPEDLTPGMIEDSLVDHYSGIRFLLSSPKFRDEEYISKVDNFEIIARFLPQLSADTIVDLGPGLSKLNQKVFPYCSDIVLIVEPILQSVAQSKALIAEFSQLGINHDQIRLTIFNRIHSSLQLSFGEVEEQLGLKIASAFSPNRELINQASIEQTPFMLLKPEGLTAQQINQLAASIVRQEA
jgi:CheY-like chemotaxis protein/MinD-like ATPase involved in chromosome partitioning or flagellar assembly